MKLIFTVLIDFFVIWKLSVEKIVNETTPPAVSAAYCKFKQWLE